MISTKTWLLLTWRTRWICEEEFLYCKEKKKIYSNVQRDFKELKFSWQAATNEVPITIVRLKGRWTHQVTGWNSCMQMTLHWSLDSWFNCYEILDAFNVDCFTQPQPWYCRAVTFDPYSKNYLTLGVKIQTVFFLKSPPSLFDVISFRDRSQRGWPLIQFGLSINPVHSKKTLPLSSSLNSV